MGDQQLPTNKLLSQGATSSIFLFLFLCFPPTQLLRSVLWLVCLSVACVWLLPQSLLLAPQSHCSTLYLSCLISSSFPPFFFHSPRLLSLFILTLLSPPPASFSSLSLTLTHTHTHVRVTILFLALSQFGASSLTGTHHFEQLRFLRRRRGAAPLNEARRDRSRDWQRLGPASGQIFFTTSYWLLQLLSLCKIMSATLLVAANKKTWNIYEVWALRDNRQLLVFVLFWVQTSWKFLYCSSGSIDLENKSKAKLHESTIGAHTASRPAPICQPANRYYWVLQGSNKAPLHLYANLLFCFFDRILKQMNLLFKLFLMFYEKENLPAQ